MNIDQIRSQNVYKSFADTSARNDENGADKKVSDCVSEDRVEISSASSSLSEARELVSQSGIAGISGSAPGNPTDASERAERIEDLRQQVEAGTYSVSSHAIAKSILAGNFMDKRA